MRLLAAVLACCVITHSSHAQTPARDTVPKRGIVMGAHVVGLLTPSASTYFAAMQKRLGSTASAFPAMTGLAGSMSIDFAPVFSVVLHAQTLALSMDGTSQYASVNSTTGVVDTSANGVDHWTAQTYPFLVGVRYTPIRSRFQSYVIALGGFAISHFRWDHTVTSTSDPDRFHSGTSEGTSVGLAAAVGVGFELLFDEFQRREVLRGISIEARYRWSDASAQLDLPFAGPPPNTIVLIPTYPVFLSGFELIAGLHFQFYH